MKFRKGIGAIILDKNDNIIAFQRSDYRDNWQEPEGGIEENETPLEALKRELKEEVGLEETNYVILKKTKKFFRYSFDKQFMGFDGQEKKFFLVKLLHEPHFTFNNKEDEIEFSDFKSMNSKELIRLAPKFKEKMYAKIIKEFNLD